MGFRSVITFIVLTFALHSCMDDDGGKIHQAYGLPSEHPDSAYITLMILITKGFRLMPTAQAIYCSRPNLKKPWAGL